MSTEPKLRLEHVTKQFDIRGTDEVFTAVEDINIDVAPGSSWSSSGRVVAASRLCWTSSEDSVRPLPVESFWTASRSRAQAWIGESSSSNTRYFHGELHVTTSSSDSKRRA